MSKKIQIASIILLGFINVFGWFVPLTGGMRDHGFKYLCFYGVLFSIIMTVFVLRFLAHYKYSATSFCISFIWFLIFIIFNINCTTNKHEALWFSLFSFFTGIVFVTYYIYDLIYYRRKRR